MDEVCVNYKDLDYLKEECEDGRRLGFNGKVCFILIHLWDCVINISCRILSKPSIQPRSTLYTQHSCLQRKVVDKTCFVSITDPVFAEIFRAARIIQAMKKAHVDQRGAIGLELEGGGKEMIDAPMIKQVSDIFQRCIHYAHNYKNLIVMTRLKILSR